MTLTNDELRERNRRPDHVCQCGHRHDDHSYDRADDFMCLVCPPHPEPGYCFYDPMTKEEWAQVFAATD